MAPPNYDPAKRYPVIHRIYGGPNDAVVPPSPRNGSLWDLSTFARAGFVVVMIDGRGTPGRGREFQNFGYGRFGQVEIADQIEGLRNLAKTRPYMDLERVGLNGGSWGGYFGLRAALLAPDLYKAGVFGAGAYEMRRMRVSAEPYVGCSLQKCRERYDKASNLALIKRLKAPLLLFHGTADDDVPVEETKHLMAALDGAGKPYEFVEIPGWPHFYSNWPETSPRTVAFFQKHLGPPRTAGTH
jgi:dipeptidyl aminopeptidase/acylaminoacyl peptidase